MARSPKSVFLRLETLSFDLYRTLEGGGGSDTPSLTPYMWTIFFVVDGTTLSVNAGFTVSGQAQVTPTTGSREDLGSPRMLVGQSVAIDSDLGLFASSLNPIPVDPSANLPEPDFPGYFGAIAVVMQQGGYLTDQLARVGEDALNAFATQAIANLIASLGPAHPTITPDDVKSATAGASDAVKSAITNAAAWWQKIAILFAGTDAEIGHVVWTFSQDDFTHAADTNDITTQFGPLYNRWSIHGFVTVTGQCAADATVFSMHKNTTPHPDRSAPAEAVLTSMRRWRDSGDLRKVPSAAWWWDVLCGHSAEIGFLVYRHALLREAIKGLLPGAQHLLDAPDRPIPDEFLQNLTTAIDFLRIQGSPALAGVAERGLRIAAALHGRSFQEAEMVLAAERMQRAART